MTWSHTFNAVDIGSQSTITNLRPGNKIAEAITEIQNKCVAAVSPSGAISARIENNILSLSIDENERVDSGIGLPDGGDRYQVLQRDENGNAVWDYVRAH